MQNGLLPYYNQELANLRQLGREFATQFPKIAGRLLLEEGASEDPHVERLIEAFAFIAARIHHKLDDEFSEIPDALLGILYPHYLRPIPSMSVVQLHINPTEISLSNKLTIPRHSQLLSRRVQDMPCRFRTAYPVDLWPLFVASAQCESVASYADAPTTAAIRLCLQTYPAQFFDHLAIDRVRFFLQGELAVTHTLYELLFNNIKKISIKVGDSQFTLPAKAIQAVGFDVDEGLLDYDSRSSLAYRLLHEYFIFPDKFMFFDLTGLDALVLPPKTQRIEILFYINEFEDGQFSKLSGTINADTFRLGCTPIVNLFRQHAEPLHLTHQKTEYPLVPDIRRPWGMEVYAVNAVKKIIKSDERTEMLEYQPLFGLHHANTIEAQHTFWCAARKPAVSANDAGSDVYLSFVDLHFNPSDALPEVLSIDITCTNRDLPELLPFGGKQSDFEIENGSSVSSIHCLRKPTPTLRPARGKAALWQLISHLSLNYLSVIDGVGENTEAFRELLGLYNFTHSAATRKQICGITRLSSKPAMTKLGVGGQVAFVRGIEVMLVLDEDQFDGSGIYLFSAVLERFFGIYASINSFTKLTVSTLQRETVVKSWPPRAGHEVL